MRSVESTEGTDAARVGTDAARVETDVARFGAGGRRTGRDETGRDGRRTVAARDGARTPCCGHLGVENLARPCAQLEDFLHKSLQAVSMSHYQPSDISGQKLF